MIKIERLTNGIEDEIDRLAAGPTQADLFKFDVVLTHQFVATLDAVHVVTGSLKSSAKVASNATEDKWEGQISYGGVSAGIHNPVDYAEYERERDGDHDFLAPAEALSDSYIAAMNSFLEG